MHREYVAQFGGLDSAAMRAEAAKPPPNRFLEVGDARYDITVQMIEAFGRPEAFANGLLVKFLRPLLGEDMRLSNFTIVVAHPGASQQHVHRDHGHLFFQPGVGPNLPVFAVNVAVPLVDVDIETGPTGILLGSHRSEQNSAKLANLTACTWRRGDCVLLDYRTMHAGLANFSQRARPIVYMVYACPWFFDDVNHINRISLDMPLEQHFPTRRAPAGTRQAGRGVRQSPRREMWPPGARLDATIRASAVRAKSSSNAMGVTLRASPHNPRHPVQLERSDDPRYRARLSSEKPSMRRSAPKSAASTLRNARSIASVQ
jgi:ectoine hydroxylase-related dioxygenase (phytanoyl-CoA dioxygenase family)